MLNYLYVYLNCRRKYNVIPVHESEREKPCNGISILNILITEYCKLHFTDSLQKCFRSTNMKHSSLNIIIYKYLFNNQQNEIKI